MTEVCIRMITRDIKNKVDKIWTDIWAGGITNDKRRVTSNYNAKAEFTNMFYKQDANYFVDLNENCVVFFIGEDAGE